MSKINYTLNEFILTVEKYRESNILPNDLIIFKNDIDYIADKPEYPKPGQCCGSGCIPCVFDFYEDQMDLYMESMKYYYEKINKN